MNILKVLCLVTCLFTSILSISSYATVPKIEQEQATKTLSQISINQATAEELANGLNGIGINKAKRIVEYREKFGSFISIEQLKEVSGIGQAILDKNSGKITL